MDRVFLDANVLFSAAYRTDSALRELWNREGTELITSAYALEEARRNLAAIRPERLGGLDTLASSLTIVGLPTPSLPLPEGVELEEKDRPVLLAALLSRATHLLTGDKEHFGHLFGSSLKGVLIMPPGEYLRPAGRKPPPERRRRR